MAKLKGVFMSGNPHFRTVEDNWNLFKPALLNSVSEHIPQKSIKSRYNLPWLNHGIKTACFIEDDFATLLNKVAKVKIGQHTV